jgi:hypothetical protein
MREMLRSVGIYLPKRQDALAHVVQRWPRMRKALAREQAILEFVQVLESVIAPRLQGRNLATAHNLIEEFIGDAEESKIFRVVSRLAKLEEKQSHRRPHRVTIPLLETLCEQYRLAATLFEVGLRRLLATYDSASKSRAWADWKRMSLHDLLAVSARIHSLSVFVNAIDRNVRNALVHGGAPEVDWKVNALTFRDRNTLVTLSIGEFSEKTRRLVAATAALLLLTMIVEQIALERLCVNFWKAIT